MARGSARDLLDHEGRNLDKLWFHGWPYADVLNPGRNDIVANWPQYRADFLRRLPWPRQNTLLDKITAGTRNAELAFDLVQAQPANSELLTEIPNGATAVLIPGDDPELAEYNFGVARTLVARGKNVYLKRVRSAAPAPAP